MIADSLATTPSPFASILIFDSGVGGLTIFREVRQRYPHCSLVYASDNAAFPYGTKSEDMLIERVDLVLHQLEQSMKVDIIIVACNTASTVVLPYIRKRFIQPIIGVVPAIKPAVAISQFKTIGLLATLGTVNREYTNEMIEEFAHDCEVISVGSNELVYLVEKKLRGEIVSQRQLLSIVEPFISNICIDTIVLACTHFPLIKTELQSVLPNIKHWVDSTEAIANRVGYYLQKQSQQLSSKMLESEMHFAYFTKQDYYVYCLRKALAAFAIKEIRYITINAHNR